MAQSFIPAVFIRGGSSKGVFFHEKDLPADRLLWDGIFLGVLGSPDGYGRQLDGMGGGVSSLSKVVVISPSTRDDADIDYTFGQVSVDRPVVDYGANCGNLSSAVGPFAVDENLLSRPDGEAVVAIHNTNTGKIIHARFEVAGGKAATRGDCTIAGVSGTGSPVRLDFLSPGGSKTTALLPTGKPVETLTLADGTSVEASLVDATNPVVFIDAVAMGLDGTESPDAIEADLQLMARLDDIRRAGAVAMGLAENPQASGLANPKIAMVAAPADFRTLDRQTVPADAFDVAVRMLSMERSHRAVTLTGAMCLGTACKIPGTIPARLCRPLEGREEIRVGNPSGVIAVGAEVSADGRDAERASVFRTQRRLMQGTVAVPEGVPV